MVSAVIPIEPHSVLKDPIGCRRIRLERIWVSSGILRDLVIYFDLNILRSARYAPHMRTFLDVGFRVIVPDMPTVSGKPTKPKYETKPRVCSCSMGDQQGGSTSISRYTRSLTP